MTLYKLFLALSFAVSFVSSRSNFSSGTLTAWNHPEFAAKYPLLSDAVTKGSQNYDPVKVINAMRYRERNLKIITAHRGIFGPGCPENTICAVDAAITAGIESVEIDVQADLNGHLWPIHDRRIGRVTNFAYPGYDMFDPWTDEADFPSNPLIATTETSQLATLWARDTQQKVCVPFKDLQDILAHIKERGNIAVMLDVKTLDAVKQAVVLIRSLGMQHSAGIKFLDTILDPSNSEDMKVLDGINFVPVQFVSHQDIIASKAPWWKSAKKAVKDYDKLYVNVKGFLNFELSCKMWSWWLFLGWLPTGPTEFIQKYIGAPNSRVNVGNFIPTPDVPQGYFNTDGKCCYQLNSVLATSKYFGTETRDDRVKADVMILTHDILTADDVSNVLRLAEEWNYRQTSPLFKFH